MPTPTYSHTEALAMIRSMDDIESIDLLAKLLDEEQYLYNVLDYGQLYKEVCLQKEKINFKNRNRK